MTYRIIRFYMDPEKRNATLHTGLTLEEAREHCNDPETSSHTCQESVGRSRTKNFGPWFDGFTAEG